MIYNKFLLTGGKNPEMKGTATCNNSWFFFNNIFSSIEKSILTILLISIKTNYQLLKYYFV